MPDLHQLREQIAGLEPPGAPYVSPQNAGYRNGWFAALNTALAIIDAAIAGEGIPQRVTPASVRQIEAQTKQVRATLTDRVSESMPEKGE
jgi:hypothetical protein